MGDNKNESGLPIEMMDVRFPAISAEEVRDRIEEIQSEISDFQKLKNTFDELGIKYKEKKFPEIESKEYEGKCEFNSIIKLKNGVGYYRFHVDFYFVDGKYQGHGVWE